MVRSARSRAVAISTWWTSSGRPTRSGSPRVRTPARRPAAGSEGAAIRAVASRTVAAVRAVASRTVAAVTPWLAFWLIKALPIAITCTLLSHSYGIRFGGTALSPLSLEKVEGRSSQLSGVELSQQRLQRDDLAWCDAPAEHRPQLLPD